MKWMLPLLLLVALNAQAREYELKSPSGKLSLKVDCGPQTSWSLSIDGTPVTEGNRMALEIVRPVARVLGDKAVVQKVVRTAVSREVETPLYRQKSVREAYNGLVLKMKGGYDIELRAYDEGVAYRFVTHFKDSLSVKNEVFQFHTGGAMDAVIPYQRWRKEDIYESSFENQYSYIPAGEPMREDYFAFLPMLAGVGDKGKLLLTEADILDYPGMFVSTGADVWEAVFPPIPTAFRYSKRYNQHRYAYSDILAVTAGQRSFPWRVLAYAEKDTDLPCNDLSWLLATPSKLEDLSWIEPGLSAWDWWNGFRLTGVDFESGINTATYKYHIDFAARFGLKYIIVDEGWYKVPDILTPIPEMDIPTICAYAASKGVKVILWSTGGLVDMVGPEKVCAHYAAQGVAGLKLDFFDGQDQLTVQQIERLAAAAAAHKMILDLHGMYKPAGLNRSWPHILGFEGVLGEEAFRKEIDFPLYDVTFPYLRQVSGPTDYTPGAMRSAARKERAHVSRGAYAWGTRAHQVGMYVVLDQPLGILCDSPSLYEQEPETTAFIAAIPTVFDRSFIQSGKLGESIVSVREKDGKWYVGGLTNWDARDVEVDLSFLPAGQWKARIYTDGTNAHKFGVDYRLSSRSVSPDTVLPIHMAPGGGFAIILERF